MSVAAVSTTPVVPRRRSAILDFCTQQPLGAASFVVIFVMMFAGIFAEYVAPYNPLDIDFGGILSPPSWEHPGGTDAFGRDIFSRIIYGSRTALFVGFFASFFGASLGTVVGVASAYFGGKADLIVQRFMIAATEGESSAMSTLIIGVPRAPLNCRLTGHRHRRRLSSNEATDDFEKAFLVENGFRQVRVGAGFDAAAFVGFRLQGRH